MISFCAQTEDVQSRNHVFLADWNFLFTSLFPLLITCSPSSNIFYATTGTLCFLPSICRSVGTLSMMSWCLLSLYPSVFPLVCSGSTVLFFINLFHLNKPEQLMSPDLKQCRQGWLSICTAFLHEVSFSSADTRYQRCIKDMDNLCLLAHPIALGDKQGEYECVVACFQNNKPPINTMRGNTVVVAAVGILADHKCKQDIVALRIS